LLDCGRVDLAERIAKTALDMYHRETQASYFTFEHFMTETGRGAGWHHFSGLSTPILSWFNAYYKMGTATTGFDVWIKEQQFTQNNDGYAAVLRVSPSATGRNRAMLVCLDGENRYIAVLDGKTIPVRETIPGLLAVTLPTGIAQGRLEIRKVE